MKKPLISLLNHGCPKNLVDAELMLGMIAEAGYSTTLDDASADVVLVNTCSFIHDAEAESVRSILEVIHSGKKVIVTGCLAQKHKDELVKEIPEAVAFVGTSEINKIVDVLKTITGEKPEKTVEINDNPNIFYPENIVRQQITVGSSSYIKIAEGCNYKCGYCIIPALRGPYNSRSIENIVKEAEFLGEKGVSEIVLIAQDTSYYGLDRYKTPKLAELLHKLNAVESINWIRVMYTYPSMINSELIEAFATLEKVVKYIDMPLQHSHPDILRAMNRPVMDYREIILELRSKIKDVALRTAVIVGYPTETQEQFEHLYEFVKEMRFDKLGAFEYSREKNTPSYSMKPQISAKIKKERKKEIVQLQQKISLEINQGLVGKKLPSIIESINSNGTISARTYRDAPEIDGVVYINTDKMLVPGDIELVKITGADEYDLYGKV